MFVTLKKDYLGHKAGATLDVHEEPVARSLIEQAVAEAVPGDPYGPLMARAVEASVASLTKNLDAVINATLTRIQGAQEQSRRGSRPVLFGEGGDGDARKCFGDWLVQVALAGGKNPKAAAGAADRLEKVYGSSFNPWQKAAMGESSGATGGYIVPPDFYQQLLQIAAEESTFRQRAFVQPMASATLQFPYLDISTAQAAGNSPFFGGVIANWTSEAQTRTEVEPAFKMMELKAQELSGYSVSSNILLQDAAFGLEKFLFTLFGKAVSWYEEYAFLQGNGVGKPLGIVNAGASIVSGPNAGARTTANKFQFADLAWMLSKLLPASYNRAVWYVSPTVVPQMLQLTDGANRAIFISIDQGVTKPPVWKLLNLPVTITEKLPALGTTGDVLLCDPSLYVIGDRMMLEVAASEHVNFLKNQMTWRFVQRVDGRPWLDAPITLQDGTSQVSPFIVLHS